MRDESISEEIPLKKPKAEDYKILNFSYIPAIMDIRTGKVIITPTQEPPKMEINKQEGVLEIWSRSGMSVVKGDDLEEYDYGVYYPIGPVLKEFWDRNVLKILKKMPD